MHTNSTAMLHDTPRGVSLWAIESVEREFRLHISLVLHPAALLPLPLLDRHADPPSPLVAQPPTKNSFKMCRGFHENYWITFSFLSQSIIDIGLRNLEFGIDSFSQRFLNTSSSRSNFFHSSWIGLSINEKEISTTVYGDSDLKNGRQDYR